MLNSSDFTCISDKDEELCCFNIICPMAHTEEKTGSGSSSREREIYKVTVTGSIGNMLLLLFKFIAGFIGNSSAMIADAVHSLSDFVTDIIVIVFVRISNKPQDKSHDYGHGKYETLATAIIGAVLFFVGLGIMWKSGSSIWSVIKGEQLESPGIVALVAALVSIVVKEILYRYTAACGKKYDSQAVIANAWHHRSDAMSSIGTAVGIGGAILLGEKWRVLDPIAALIVSVFIIKVSVELLVPCLEELLEKSLPEETEKEIEDILLSFPGVSHPHNLRTRRIGNTSSIEVHIRMDGNMTVSSSHAITASMERKLKEILGPGTYVNIHVEPTKEDCCRQADNQ